MADDADIVASNAEFTAAVNRYKSQKPTINASPTGRCLYCDEPVPENHRWCYASCRDDWKTENL